MYNTLNVFIKNLRKAFRFSGRTGRKEFLIFLIFIQVVSFFLLLLFSVIFEIEIWQDPKVFRPKLKTVLSSNIALSVFIFLLYFLFGMSLISISVRRLHDIGFSGWWLLTFGLLGFYAVFDLILLSLLVQPGEERRNAYGLHPGEVQQTDIEETKDKEDADDASWGVDA